MRYWDASAIVPLLIVESGTNLARGWLRDDPHIVTWALTVVEVTGAIERRARQGALANDTRRDLLQRLRSAAMSWDEVIDLLPVRTRALSILARHSLRAADAMQLAAAAAVAEGDPSSLTFVCLDRALADVAEREGFHVLYWSE
jgi:hypothetical protein